MKLHVRKISEGRPLVLMHGLFGMSDNLQSFAKLLADEGYAVYLADLRNHGHSPHDNEHSYPAMAKDIAELISDHQLEKPLVVGHSMGGKVAMQLAIDYPNLPAAIVVIDIAPYAYPVHHREILDALLAVDLEKITVRSQAEEVLKERISDNGTRQFLLKNLYWKEHKLAWRFNLKVLNEQIETIGQPTWPADTCNLPVLFVAGGNSGYIHPQRISEIRQRYTSADFVTIEGAGHWVHAEKPQELLQAVTDFAKNLSV